MGWKHVLRDRRTTTHRRVILRLLTFAIAGYALVNTLIFTMQERLIFFPEYDPPGTRYAFGVPSDEVVIPVAGAQLHALLFHAPAPRGVILYLHGNAGSLRSWGALAPDLVAYGYDLLMVDYRGYGRSSGRITSETQLHADMAVVYDWVATRYAEQQIVLYGRSLGSSLAVRLAAERRPRLLILESPFYSLEAIARQQFPWVPPFLLKYPLRSWSWIGQVRCPVMIIHGTADTVVPFADGKRLAETVTAPLRFQPVEGGGHNDLARFPAYHTAIAQALGPQSP